MGNWFSSPTATEQVPVIPTTDLPYSPSSTSCTYEDKAYFTFRMHQLQFMNYIIRKLSKVLCLPAETIDFPRLFQDVLTYKTIDGNEAEGYEYDILAQDPSLKGPAESQNRFADLQAYPSTKGGRSQQETKTDLLEFLEQFVRLRSALLDIVTQKCT